MKTKRKFITKLKENRYFLKSFFVILGITSTLWFLFRVIPKPSRAAYPCMRASAPIMSSFVLWLLSLSGSVLAFKYAKDYFKKSRYAAALTLSAVVILSALIFFSQNIEQVYASTLDADANHPANAPVGVERGIKPGRVVWVRDTNVALWDGINGNWFSDENTSTEETDKMVSAAIKAVGDNSSESKAWNAIFENFNKRKYSKNQGYKADEKIAIKVNQNNTSSHENNGNEINACPQLIYSLLKSLIIEAKVAPADIVVADPSRFITNNIFDKCHAAFPEVVFVDNSGKDGRTKSEYVNNAIPYSADNGQVATGLATCFTEATYVINMPIMKGHVGQGVTFGGKNWYGATSIDADWRKNFHNNFDPKAEDKYLIFVDYMGHKDLGEKTVLFLMDAIYTCQNLQGLPGPKWTISPFNNSWPGSIFASQDGVACDAVAVDFFRTQYPTNVDMAYVDKYLIEASQANNPPSGVFYDPEKDGTRLTSLGVFERWNNPQEMKYSRNLGKKYGIELFKQDITTTTASIK